MLISAKRRILIGVLACLMMIASLGSLSYFDEDSAFAEEAITKPTTIEELRNADPTELAKLDSFDSRDYDLIPLTGRNQISTNLCWAFATLGAIEANILRKGLDPSLNADNINFSEKHLAWVRRNRDGIVDPLGNTDGFAYSGEWNKTCSTDDAAQVMLQWTTLIDQTVGYWDEVQSKGNNERYADRDEISFIAQEVIYVNHSDRDAIKEAVAKYGAVTVTFSMGAQDKYKKAEYFSGKGLSGSIHACIIVGWDDNIEKEKFEVGTQPSENGGWIVRDSFGETEHNNGCYYMSYETVLATRQVVAYDMVLASDYDNNYYYDGNATSATKTLKSSVSSAISYTTAAAIFQAKGVTEASKVEWLKAVNVGVNVNNATTLKVEVYTGVDVDTDDTRTAGNRPQSGELKATKQIAIKSDGSFLVTFDDPIALEQGEYFSVVATIDDGTIMMCDIDGCDASSTRTYYYDQKTSSWKNVLDCTTTNGVVGVARIKAFTVEQFETRTDISDCDITLDAYEFTYSGKAVTPHVTVTDGPEQLTAADYTVTYSNNVNAGTATVTVEGKGQYKGTVTKDFEIKKANRELTVAIEDWTYSSNNENCKQPTVSGSGSEEGTVIFTYSTTLEGVYAPSVPRDAGTYYVRAEFAEESANYLAGVSEAVSFTIHKADKPKNTPTEIEIPEGATTLSQIPLPDGWEWLNPDTVLEGSMTVKAVYCGDDKDNYELLTVEFDITIEIPEEPEEPDIDEPDPNPNPDPDDPNEGDNADPNDPDDGDNPGGGEEPPVIEPDDPDDGKEEPPVVDPDEPTEPENPDDGEVTVQEPDEGDEIDDEGNNTAAVAVGVTAGVVGVGAVGGVALWFVRRRRRL